MCSWDVGRVRRLPEQLLGGQRQRGEDFDVTFKPKIWEPIAWILCLVNVGAVWFAALPAETWHATAHAVLAVAFGLWAQRLRGRRGALPHLLHGLADRPAGREAQEPNASVEDPNASVEELEDLGRRLSELEERVDFAERLLTKQREAAKLPESDR